MRHGEPALKRAKHRACSLAIVKIALDRQATGDLPRIIFFPSALEHCIVNVAQTIAILLPALDRASIDMWAQGKSVVAGQAHSQAVGVERWVRHRYVGRRVFRVPVLKKELVHFHQVGVAAGLHLRRTPVEFIDLWVLGWEGSCLGIRLDVLTEFFLQVKRFLLRKRVSHDRYAPLLVFLSEVLRGSIEILEVYPQYF